MRKLTFLVLFFLFSLQGQASQIRIIAAPQFELKREKQGIEIEGSYFMKNAGDEIAKNVYPHLFLDFFELQGEPADLPPGGSHIWKWKERIPSQKLSLPLEGQVLLRIQNHYQDANGYAFAVPQIGITGFGKPDPAPSGQALMALKIRKIDEDTFQADYEVHNQLDVDMDLKLDAVLPQEVQLLSTLSKIKLKEKASLFGTFQFKNKKGLQGSRYYAYVTAQWENAGARKVAWAFAPFFIGQQPEPLQTDVPTRLPLTHGQIFWCLWGVIAMIGLLLMSQYWTKPLQKLK